jgi:hypothetical protein
MFFYFLEKEVIIGLWELPNDNQLFSNLWKPTFWESINFKNIYIFIYPVSVYKF